MKEYERGGDTEQIRNVQDSERYTQYTSPVQKFSKSANLHNAAVGGFQLVLPLVPASDELTPQSYPKRRYVLFRRYKPNKYSMGPSLPNQV